MPFAIPAIFFNIWFRRAILAVSLVAAYFIWQGHQRSIGRQQGSANESQQNATVQAKNQESDRQTTVTQITVLSQQIALLQKQVETQQTIVLSLIQQRQQLPAQIQGMTAQQVRDIINQALGKPQGSNEGYTAQDDVKIATCFKDLDLCNKQTTAQAQQVADLTSSADKQEQKYQTLAGYTSRVEQNYTALWNDKAQAKRSGKCLWLWHCSKPSIKAPDPKDLLRRPQ